MTAAPPLPPKSHNEGRNHITSRPSITARHFLSKSTNAIPTLPSRQNSDASQDTASPSLAGSVSERKRTISSPFAPHGQSAAFAKGLASSVNGKGRIFAAKANEWSRKKLTNVQANTNTSSNESVEAKEGWPHSSPVGRGIAQFNAKARGWGASISNPMNRSRSASTPATGSHGSAALRNSDSSNATVLLFGVKVPRSLLYASGQGQVFGQSLETATKSTRLMSAEKLAAKKLLRSESAAEANWPPARRKRAHERQEAQVYLPGIVIRCLDYIELHATTEEGLYRVPGSSQQVQQLRQLFDAGLDVDLCALTAAELDPHSVASCFKLWLRDLPESLLTAQLEPTMDQLMMTEVATPATAKQSLTQSTSRGDHRLTSGSVESPANTFIDKMAILLATLPNERWYLLRELAAHLREVDSHAKVNKMTLSNLRLILSPTLRTSPAFLQLLVEHQEILFDRDRAHAIATPQTSPNPSVRYPSSQVGADSRRPSAISERLVSTPSGASSSDGILAQQQALSLKQHLAVQVTPERPKTAPVTTPIAEHFQNVKASPKAEQAPLSAPPFIARHTPNSSFFVNANARMEADVPRTRTSSMSSVQSAQAAKSSSRGRKSSNQSEHSQASKSIRSEQRNSPQRFSSLSHSTVQASGRPLTPLSQPKSEGLPVRLFQSTESQRSTPELGRSSNEDDSDTASNISGKRNSASLDNETETLHFVPSPKRARVPSLAPSITIALPRFDKDDFLSEEDRKKFFDA